MIEKLKTFGDLKENVSFKTLSTYRIGGLCRYLSEPHSLEDLVSLLDYLREENIQHKVIGLGSNILFSDLDYDGVVVKTQKALNKIEIKDDLVIAQAGVSLIKLAHQCVNAQKGGLEFASGIPGTLGGALFMNAGAYQKSMYDMVNRVLVYRNHELKWLNREDIKVDYRYSSFMEEKETLICAAELSVHPCDPIEAKKIMNDRLERRLSSQPLELPSCGSVFRNPYPELSWHLIESVGLRGYQIGDAQISLKHANFIVNLGQAKASDVIELIELVQKKVFEKHGIHLVREVELFNFL